MVTRKSSWNKGIPCLESTKLAVSRANKGKTSSFKGKHHSEASKEKLRLVHLGKHLSEEHKQKLSIAGTGRIMSDETRHKLSLALKGKPFSEQHKQNMRGIPKSEEHKKKISLSHMGIQTWLGKHHTEETKRKIGLQSTLHNTGRPSPLKGTHISEEHKEKIRKSCIGINTGKRPPFSEEWRRKLGDAGRGKKRPFTSEHRKNVSLAQKELSARIRISKPQKELFAFLKTIFKDAELEYPIQTKETFRFADVGVPSLKIDFEYDEEYWHQKRIEKDNKRDKELSEVGWATFRITNDSLKILSQQKIFTMMRDIP